MKKLTALVLALLMLVSLVLTSCGNENTNTPEQTEQTQAKTEDKQPEKAEPVSKTPTNVFDTPKSSTLQAPEMVKVSDVASQGKDGSKGVQFDPMKFDQMEITGFPYMEENQNYNRFKKADMSKYPSSVQGLATKCAGGRIRFRTNTKSMTINVTLADNANYAHMTYLGANGLDIYTGTGSAKKFYNCVKPNPGTLKYSATFTFSGNTTEYTIILPLYASVSSIAITLDKDAKVGLPTPYAIEKPVVFYGSSITMGCSASRPGTNYCEVVTRMLDANLVNLGLNGSAKGEKVVAEYIAGLEMSAFVLDYDYNASDAAELQKTHYEFYKTIRDAQPDLPIIIMTRCNVDISDTDSNAQRRKVIKDTYDKAVAAGDKNVYFIDGQYVYPEIGRELCTIDGAHPTDLGMFYMGQALYPILKEVLYK